jgi:hypothetical protein
MKKYNIKIKSVEEFEPPQVDTDPVQQQCGEKSMKNYNYIFRM